MNTIIIKLGGSIITAKRSRKPRIERAVVAAIAQDIAAFRSKNPDVRIVLLHGAGSFGHPLAHRYGLVRGRPTPTRMIGAAQTIASMRTFGNMLSEIMWKEKLPVVPLQTSAMVPIGRGDAMIERLLQVNAIPMLNGDVVLRNGMTDIMSADEQVIALVNTLKPSKIAFLTDVDGVYRRFPPTGGERPMKKISRSDVRVLLLGMKRTLTSTDVTGGMQGKLTALLGLRNVRVIMCNGKRPHALLRALGGLTGTLVQL